MAKNTNYKVTFADNSVLEVQTTLEDRLAFETALRKNRKWGKIEDNTLKMQPFMAWNALRRTGKTDLSWEQFTSGSTAALSVDQPEDEEDDELEIEGVGKDTQKAPSTTSPASSQKSTEEPHGSGAVKKPRK